MAMRLAMTYRSFGERDMAQSLMMLTRVQFEAVVVFSLVALKLKSSLLSVLWKSRRVVFSHAAADFRQQRSVVIALQKQAQH